MSSMWGERIKLSIFGGSHTAAIGCTLDGLPAGEAVDWEQVRAQLARRAPGQDPTATARREPDEPKLLCGLVEGITTGEPLTAVIENTDTRSKDYSLLRDHPRPGHADYTAWVKTGGHNDIRGGGHFSGRLTGPLVLAGAVARQLIRHRGITVGSHVVQISRDNEQGFDESYDGVNVDPAELEALSTQYFPVRDPAARARMRETIAGAKARGDSVGGTVECVLHGLPAGLGEPMFGGVESLIASLVYGIPAVKGVEFGAGFSAAYLYGSENNDAFYFDENGQVRTRTNRAGGILGGITTGMPVVFQAAFKPTPSISLPQETVDLRTGQAYTLTVEGRHDPCIVPRAAPVVEAAACLAALELLARSGRL